MKCYLFLIATGLLTISFCSFGHAQKHNCQIKIVKLKFAKNIDSKSSGVSDGLLTSANPTDSLLVSDTEIKKLEIKTDSACCTYTGQIYLTSHQYTLTKKAVSRLSALQIPLCCGIPFVVYINETEVYRGMLWNVVSSFGNKTITATLIGDKLTITNQLPRIPDFRNSILTLKKPLVNCLLNR